MTSCVPGSSRAADPSRLLALVEQVARVGHWRLDIKASRLVWSCEVFRMFGLDPMFGPPSLEQAINAYHPEDREIVSRFVADAIANRRSYDFEARLVTPDGEIRNVVARGMCELDADGEVATLFGTVADVTEAKRAEQAVRESEARYRLLAENTSELIMLGHDDGRRSYISPASERLLGFTPDELAAMRLRDYVHPDDLADLYAATARLAQGAQEASIVYRARHKTGGWIWVEGVFRRIPQARPGEPTIVATFRDVCERVRVAEALKQAKEAAESASRAKTDFLASMSHELRTPLNGIIGYTDLLLESASLDAVHRRHAERIQTAGAALLTIVNDVLDFSEIENGRVEIEQHPFELETLLDGAASLVGGFAEKKGVEMRLEVSPDIPRTLIGDSDRLRQVLLNLLNNAVKFTPSGSVTLSVNPEAGRESLASLRFTVSDTGIGIPEDKRKRLFHRFSQIDGSIRRDYGGTGLGLAISKSLVDLMGGAIGVESAPGMGSTFWFTVDLKVGAAAAIAAAGAGIAPAVQPARILLVEDLDINQELARAVLERAGHSVEVAGDGAQAVQMAQGAAFDLILMDIHMPVMDGVAATRQIRALPGAVSGMPIIAMTANVLPEQIRAFHDAGMDDHVGKPFRAAELLQAIDRWAAKPQATPEAPESADDGFDVDAFAELRQLVGDETLGRLLGSLKAQLTGAPREHADHVSLGREAHAMVSSAGMLGFLALSKACQDLERSCECDVGVDGALARVKNECAAALGAIVELTEATSTGREAARGVAGRYGMGRTRSDA